MPVTNEKRNKNNINIIKIPELAVVALVGASSSGKSRFAEKHFKPTEVLSSDKFRALVSDDENNQAATSAAFDALYYVANKRLDSGLMTVVDATNTQKEARRKILETARSQNCHACAIVFDMPEKLMQERNKQRPDRNFGEHVIKNQNTQLRKSIRYLEKEGFRYVYILKSEDEVNGVKIVREPLWNNKKEEKGPFDIVGDIHGCYDELCNLLVKLGYDVDSEKYIASHKESRKAVFLGDLCDRGDKNTDVLKLVMNMVHTQNAYCIAGNHDVKLLKKLRGANIQPTHGLSKTIEQLELEPSDFSETVRKFIDSLISHYVFDGGSLVVAHAGLKESYHGRASSRVRDFCLYGDTNGETDEYGLPVRVPWANEYRGKALVVYGHMPSIEIQNINNTYCIDTGCVFGGKLSAFRYPEKEIVSVKADKEYYRPIKPMQSGETTNQADGDLSNQSNFSNLLHINDVIGQKYISVKYRQNIKINAENSAAALEIMSRYAIDPRWLIYLPPTMSPCETSKSDGFLEYPTEAFDYYKSRGVGKVICEQKHMGSRAVIIVCKDKQTAKKKFGECASEIGVVYTRTGRHFFDSGNTETEILKRLNAALTVSGFWTEYNTDWVCLDAEIMPWSAKAAKLLEEQYACVGRAGRNGMTDSLAVIEQAAKLYATAYADGETAANAEIQTQRHINLADLAHSYKDRLESLNLYTESYRRYCWTVRNTSDYKIAPFHILATDGKVWNKENHVAHMETIKKYITGTDEIFMATPYIAVDLIDEKSVADAVQWWEELTGSGGEGMVVKPLDFISTKGGELLQPAVKCRGREYLRIIYGPEYTLRGNLERLKKRTLSKKRGLALAEFALGMESLERFANGEPLHRVHECVFGVLALESEPVDPRL